MVVELSKKEQEILNSYEKLVPRILEKFTLILSNVRLGIIMILSKQNNLTKTEIHDSLIKAGIKMNYKNTSANIDKLEKAKIVSYDREKRYNRLVVSLNYKEYTIPVMFCRRGELVIVED